MDKKDSKPTFVNKEGCTYTFWWDHHLACPGNSSHLITQDSCMVTDEKTGHVFDFRPLKDVRSGLSTVDKYGTTYFLGICTTPNNGNKIFFAKTT